MKQQQPPYFNGQGCDYEGHDYGHPITTPTHEDREIYQFAGDYSLVTINTEGASQIYRNTLSLRLKFQESHGIFSMCIYV